MTSLPLARQGGAALNLPANFDQQIGKVVKSADVDVYVGQEDRILRRLQVALDLDLSQVAGAGSQAGRAKIDFSFALTDVNKPQDIEAPEEGGGRRPQARRPAPSPAPMLGVGVLAVDPPPGLAAARKAGFRIGDVTSPAPITNNPRKVARGGAQAPEGRDPLPEPARPRRPGQHRGRCAPCARQTKAKVFIDDIRSVDRFGPIVAGRGREPGPSIVIIDRRGKARLIEGYIDSRALAQEVADAR